MKYPENLKECIILDYKLLFHFLKEKHIIDIFLSKIYNEDNIEKPKSIYDCIRFCLNHQILYEVKRNDITANLIYDKLKIYDIDEKFKNNKYLSLLLKNPNLLLNLTLFGSWTDFPLLLSQNQFIEAELWHHILVAFMERKKILYLTLNDNT